MIPRRWWEGAGSARFKRDRAIVAGEQPGLQIVERDGIMTLEGDVVIRSASGIPDRTPTLILFPPEYPTKEPMAFEPTNRFEHDGNHHFWTNAKCCLWLDVATPWNPKDPDGLRMFLDQLALFYERQLIMLMDPTAPWPGGGWDHNEYGYIEFMRQEWGLSETAIRRMASALAGRRHNASPCPCGRRRQYRKCHRSQVDQFRSKALPSMLVRLVDLLEGRPA
jgi:hypothetical protein